KAQSALLEAMQEQQVTVDGVPHALPQPFFVVATQNPADQIGTFELPESQLDRFLMCIELGYPDAASERALLDGLRPANQLAEMRPRLLPEQILVLQDMISAVKLAPALLDYLQALVQHTRDASEFTAGLSPRASIALSNAARAFAFLQGRNAVYPDDLQAVFPAVAGHRLRVINELKHESASARAAHVLNAVAIP
ncbi:MAG: MoxR family ATPase, partial [Pseudomonadota bacterium]